jgi:hypothetical protein
LVPSGTPTNDVAVMTPVILIPVELMVTAEPTIALVDVVIPDTTNPLDVVIPDTTNPPSNCPYPAEVNVPPAPALPSCKPLFAVMIPVESILVTSS